MSSSVNQERVFCFEIYLRKNINASSKIVPDISDYKILLDSLAEELENFVFSLRYLYNPSDNQKLRSFVMIKPIGKLGYNEITERIEGLLKGSLGRFYSFTSQPGVFKHLNWVSSIGELIKHGEFVEEPEFTGYLPHNFSTELIDSDFSILEILESIECKKLVLELSLETYDSPNEQAYWRNAIKDLVSHLSSSSSKGNFVKYAFELYRNYQDNYIENQLFRYSIKALCFNSKDTYTILANLRNIVCKKNKYRRIPSILIFEPHDSNFKDSLEATRTIETFKAIKWDGWGSTIGKKIERQPINKTIKKDGLLAVWDDGSLDPTKPFLTFEESVELFKNKNLSLPQSSQFNSNFETSNLVLGGSSAIQKMHEDRISKVEHLKPLHHITTLQEVVGFIKIFRPLFFPDNSVILSEKGMELEDRKKAMHISSDILYIQELIQNHGDEITEDKYIVGIDSNGYLCVSNWERSPHRLVAGTPGAGKTNFLFSLIYQLLYANPEIKIFLADFQAGLHFHIIASQHENIKMVTQLEDFAKLLKELVDEHERRREVMIAHKSRSRIQLQQKYGIKLDRNFLIIDEAFFIQNADGATKKEIEKHLTTLAAQARVTGIHIVYCSQSPNLLNKQIKACIEERVVLRVANNNESFGLLDNFSALGLDNGMAVYRGMTYDPKSPKIVKVPFVPDEVWDVPIL